MRQRSVEIPAPPARLGADFTIPDRPSGVVLFAHGSGSSRFSKRNRHVANRLNAAGFATLLLDLLTVEEELNRANVFEIGLLTGSAAALGNELDAVVSRGGRPDLAGEALWRVTAPTLLIVGGSDLNVLALNEEAAARLRCRYEIAVVPGASHLFEEPGALDRVGELAAAWFSDSMSEARI